MEYRPGPAQADWGLDRTKNGGGIFNHVFRIGDQNPNNIVFLQDLFCATARSVVRKIEHFLRCRPDFRANFQQLPAGPTNN